MTKKFVITTVALIANIVMIALVFAGCQTQSGQTTDATTEAETTVIETTAAETSTAQTDDEVLIGVSMDELQNTFWVAAKKGMDEAAAKYGVKLEYRTAEGDAVKQNAQIDELIAMGVDAIVCVNVDVKAINQGVKAANDAKVPIVYCDRPLDKTADSAPDWGIKTDETALVTAGWEWVLNYAKTNNNMKLKVLEVEGSLNDKNVLIRAEVTDKIAEENSDVMEIVQKVLTEWDLEKTLSGTTNALQANPDINTIFMHYDGLLDPIATALKQANKWKKIGETGHVIIMPYSGNESGMKAMIDGYADMAFGMNVIGEGFKSVEAAYKIVKGEDPGPFVNDPGFIITQENLQTEGPKTYGWEGANK
ncbi:MAG: sugar ABC transporter substrate-binding protein [Actinobacteria bacterium]|nr:sugar ABC transporter substrate-binding protein [Actinomycetota bacterium]